MHRSLPIEFEKKVYFKHNQLPSFFIETLAKKEECSNQDTHLSCYQTPHTVFNISRKSLFLSLIDQETKPAGYEALLLWMLTKVVGAMVYFHFVFFHFVA